MNNVTQTETLALSAVAATAQAQAPAQVALPGLLAAAPTRRAARRAAKVSIGTQSSEKGENRVK